MTRPLHWMVRLEELDMFGRTVSVNTYLKYTEGRSIDESRRSAEREVYTQHIEGKLKKGHDVRVTSEQVDTG